LTAKREKKNAKRINDKAAGEQRFFEEENKCRRGRHVWNNNK